MTGYLVVYFILIIMYRVSEVFVMRQTVRTASQTGPDRTSYGVVLPFMACLVAAPLEYLFFSRPQNLIGFAAGACIFIAAAGLRLLGLSQLKDAFSLNIEKKPDHHLVTTGLYSVIRHPLYLTVIMLAAGASIMLAGRLVWVFVLLTVVGIVRRIDREEEFMAANFPDYQEYMRKTRRLIPGIY